MAVSFRQYNPEPLLDGDYTLMRDFLIQLDDHNYHFGRWDWMITHSHLDASGLPKIGLWLDGGAVVAAATYDCALGNAFLLALPAYRHLREAMFLLRNKRACRGRQMRRDDRGRRSGAAGNRRAAGLYRHAG